MNSPNNKLNAIGLNDNAKSAIEVSFLTHRLAREWRASKQMPLGAETPEETDVTLKETKDLNKRMLFKLAEVADRHPEIEEKLKQLCENVCSV
jgi:hypothetical protein